MRKVTGWISSILVLVVSLPVFSHGAAETSPGGEGVSRRPLVIAIAENYPPFSVTAPNGDNTGLLVEMWRLWSETTGTPVRFRASDWAGTVEAVRNGDADIHFGLFRNDERARWMDFSDPIHEIRTAVYFHAGRQDPVPLSQLAGRKVGVVRGSHQSRFLRETYPDLTVVDLEDGDAVMLALLADRVDAVVHEVPSANIELARTGLYGTAVRGEESIFSNFVHAGVRQGRGDLVARIDQGFRAIPTTRLAELERRWIPQEENWFYVGADGKIQLTNAEEAWLAAHPVIRFAVTDFITPIDIVSEKGEYSGLNADLITLLNRKLGINIVPEFQSAWGDVVERTMSGKVDGALSLSRTPEREKNILFTRPYAFDPVIAVVRRDRKDIATWEELAGKTASAVRGASMIDEVRAVLGDGTLIEVDDEAAGLKLVAQGKADAHVSWLLPFGNAQKKNPVPGLRIAVTRNTEGGTLRIGVHKSRRELYSIIRKAFNAISREELTKIRNRWLYSEGQVATAADLGLSAAEEAWLADHPIIRVGTMDNWPPISFADERGIAQGISAAFMEAVNERLGGVLKLQPGPWKETYDAVKERRLDALLDITPKQGREPFFNFTAPYLTISHAIIARSDVPYIASEADLAGKILALEKGFGNVRYFKENYPDVRVREYEDTLAALDAVARGEADAYAGNRAVATFLMEREIMYNLVPHGRLGKKPVALAIGTRKDWPVLRDILDKALASISADRRHAIVGRWVKTDGARTVELTDEERAWIKAHPLISVAATPDWPPFEGRGEDGSYEGVTADIVRLAAERVGLLVEPVFDKWEAHLEALRNGEIDLAPGLFQTPEREKFLEYTRPFVEMYDVIVSQTGRTDILSLADLDGKTVAVERGYAQHGRLLADFPATTILAVDNSLEALKAVALGKADAYIGNQVVSSFLIEANLLQNVEIAAFVDTDATFLAMAVPKDRAILRDIMDKALGSITPEERKNIIAAHVALGGVAPARRLDLTDEERAWIAAHPKIRVHNEMDWPPFNFNENGRPKGFSIAYMNLLADRLGIQIEYLSGKSWGEFLDMMRNKDLDVMLNIVRTEDRRGFMAFTEPYVDNPPVIVTRQRQATIRKFTDLFDRKVAIPKGFFYQELIERNYPRIDLMLVDDQTEALKAVAFGRADATVGGIAVQDFLIRENLLTNLAIVAGIDDETFSNRLRMGVRDDWPVLRDLLQKAIDAVSEEEIARLRERWLGSVSLDGKKVELTDEERFWIADHPSVRVAATPDWPPFEFKSEDGAYTGISADMIRAAAAKVGLKLEFVFDKWDALAERLKNKDLDVAPGLNRTPERERFLIFTEPFVEQFSAIFVAGETEGIKKMKDLGGKTVAVEKGYALSEVLRDEYPDIELLPVDNALQALQAVSLGEADAYVGNQVVASYLIKKNVIPNLKAVGVFGEQPGRLRFGVREDWPILRDILRKALAAMTKHERDGIIAKYVDMESGLRRKTVALNEDERAWLDRHREIRIGTGKPWPPIEFFDGKGKYSGIASGFVRAVGGALGVKMVPVRGLDRGAPLERIGAGDLDILAAAIPSAEAEKYVEFTKPYLSFPVVVVTRDDAPFIGALADLRGKRVGAVVGRATLDRLRRNHGDLDLVPFADDSEALNAVASGTVDGFVDNIGVISYEIDVLGLSNLKVAAPTPYTDRIAMAVRKDWPQLRVLLDKAIDSMSDAEKAAIRNEWIAIEYQLGLDWWTVFKWAAPIAAGAIVIIVVVVAWNRRLGSEIAERKQAEEKVRKILGDLNAVMEAIDYGVLFMDSDLRVQVINRAFIDIWDIDRDLVARRPTMAELLRHNQNKGVYDIPDDRFESFVEERVAAVRAGPIAPTEIVRADGVHLRYQCIALPDGWRMLTYFDITDLKEKEAELARQKKIVERTLGNLDQGIMMVDRNMCVVSRNARFAEMFSLPDEWFEPPANYHQMMRRWFERQGFDQELYEGMIADSLRREFFSVEQPQADGGVVEMRHIPLDDGGFVRSFTDITERKKAEEAIRLGGERLELALKGGDMGSWDVDLKKSTTVVNRRWWEILGYDVDEVGDPWAVWHETLHADDRERVIEIGRAYRAGEIPSYDVEYRIVTKQGETRWMVSKGATVGEDEDGSPLRMVGTVMDITARKEGERKLTEAYEIITDSIQYASRIQRSILPPVETLSSTVAEHFVMWEPRDTVGGDMYWCRNWGNGVLILLGDCTGHGVPGAFMTLIANGALDLAYLEVPPGDVATLMQRMHQLIQLALGQDRSEGDSDDGLEAGACFVQPGRPALTFVGARFSLFVSESAEVREIKGDKSGLGYRGIPRNVAFTNHSVDFLAEAIYYMTSDGLIDQIGGARKRSFGKRRFKDLLASIREMPMAEQKGTIQQALSDWQGDQRRRDDVSVLGFKGEGRPSR